MKIVIYAQAVDKAGQICATQPRCIKGSLLRRPFFSMYQLPPAGNSIVNPLTNFKMKTPYLYIVLLLALFGCSKKEAKKSEQLDQIDVKKISAFQSVVGNDIMAFYSFIETPVNGTFGIKHYQTLAPSTPARTVSSTLQFGGAFYDANNNIIPGGDITFGKILAHPYQSNGFFYSLKNAEPSAAANPRDHIGEYTSVQGTIQNIAVNPVYSPPTRSGAGNARTPAVSTGTLYFPLRLDLGIGKMQTQQYGNDSYFTMVCYVKDQTGSYDLYWNADPQNDKGIVIVLEYDDGLQGNLGTSTSPWPPKDRKRYTALRVPDNGKYTLSYQDIVNAMGVMFDKATLTVTIGRANYSFVNSPTGLEKYAIYTATASEMMLVINAIFPPRP
ncbi:hypothetical protein ACTJJ0_22995 [Chitinophaga sp. 22321]|uniref:DUF4374 domain-containing protein n=1 Tax=Chitinophaga hostae TaxID=2831022 RepID=A0ABS5JA14_9BACT|nr:hypothetical protein [Chitinophaga hostae]MBS0031442.1 hypothetical protein [Chitinophaga hostae]